MIHKRIVRFGEFSIKKERDEYCAELRGTHFQLGNGPENGVTSYVYDYRRFGLDPSDRHPPENTARALARKDFQLGTDLGERPSTYKVDYPPKAAPNAGLNKDLLKDLRATHYALGHDPNSFNTIHKQDYVDQGVGHPEDINDMRRRMRMQNFRFGDDPANYKSSAADTYKGQPRMALRYGCKEVGLKISCWEMIFARHTLCLEMIRIIIALQAGHNSNEQYFTFNGKAAVKCTSSG